MQVERYIAPSVVYPSLKTKDFPQIGEVKRVDLLLRASFMSIRIANTQGPILRRVLYLGLMIYGCHLEILNNVVFELFCKWNQVGQKYVQKAWSLGSCAVLPLAASTHLLSEWSEVFYNSSQNLSFLFHKLNHNINVTNFSWGLNNIIKRLPPLSIAK